MHRYQPLWPEDFAEWEPPDPADLVFRSTDDLVGWAALEPLTTWYTYPHVWHLDADGRWRCCSKGSSLHSVRRFANEPDDMVACRRTILDEECPDYWVVLEPRHQGLHRYDVTEEDAEAFLRLRRELDRRGVSLLDVIVFHEDFAWWSLHELTSGTTTWSFVPPRGGSRSTRRTPKRPPV